MHVPVAALLMQNKVLNVERRPLAWRTRVYFVNVVQELQGC